MPQSLRNMFLLQDEDLTLYIVEANAFTFEWVTLRRKAAGVEDGEISRLMMGMSRQITTSTNIL